VGGLAVLAFGLWGLTEAAQAWVWIVLYFYAVTAVGAALILGAWLRLSVLIRARRPARR
jgi:hypothetical protein